MVNNCIHGICDCNRCCLNGDCIEQGLDGKPRWMEAREVNTFNEFCSLFYPVCINCPLDSMKGDCKKDRWPKWKEEQADVG